ncbi:Uncharacterised protein [BD1-7 clade bacterium]|uniref:Uncharacterized protein n=1 Tax=BD1-7 clade bacterium TaxID=2029982 RepID=A0A5S9PDE2_9GAMM|nr:Uncharacterised protein [BD1-7 clade bacterium]CAA0101645.1 Uncharacterised protein [BD1-7 clade bacterium]
MTYYLVCDESINLADLTCSTGWEAVVIQPSQSEFDPGDLDPVLIAGAIGAGFFSLVPIWAAGMGLRYLLSLLTFKG